MSASIIHPAQPEQILKDLGKLWTSLGQEEKQQGKPTVLRACAMTLIAATDDADGGFAASQIISELMHEHPSRGVVLATSDNADPGLNARVLAQCWKPFGKAQQICCEQIEITASPQNWPNIGPTIVGITAADLPVVFWCCLKPALRPSATLQQKAGLDAVMNLATKVIVDTNGEEVPAALAVLAEWRAKGRLIADLEWTRLTLWREPIAQMFDPSRGNQPRNFHLIEVAHVGEKPTASVLYAGAWLSGSLKSRVRFIKTNGHGPGLHRITLRSDSGNIDFERTSADCMTLRSPNGLERKYSFIDPTLYSLMNEELRVLGPDPAFDSAFTRALDLLREL